MMYTMGMALDRAADSGVGVSILVEGSWIDGVIAAVDSMGVVLESEEGVHTVIRVDRVAAVTVHTDSPFRTSIGRGMPGAEARPMPGPVPGPRTA